MAQLCYFPPNDSNRYSYLQGSYIAILILTHILFSLWLSNARNAHVMFIFRPPVYFHMGRLMQPKEWGFMSSTLSGPPLEHYLSFPPL